MHRVGSLLVLGAAGLAGVLACSDYTKWNQPPIFLPPPPDSTPLAALHVVAQKLRAPLYVTAPPEDTTRTFIVQQFGHIRVMVNDHLLGPDFLTLTGLIDSSGGERGVLSMAFDPHYATNGRFYVDYTDTLGNIQVVRYNVSPGNPNLADRTTATPVLSIDHHLHTNHNGGLLLFGPDGYLYIGVGDGGGAGNPLHSGQDSTVLLAKILRIDVSTLPYTIPPSNPFASRPPAAPEVWDYGLRNPWRFSFDRLTHDLYIADVGQDSVEELDWAAAGDPGGHNYGWPVMEGDRCYPPGTVCSSAGLTPPILTYLHGPGGVNGCSIIGGYVYRGKLAPRLYGRYLYADLCTAVITTFKWTGAVTDEVDLAPFTAPNVHITSFGEDARGELYLTISNGIVYRFQDTP